MQIAEKYPSINTIQAWNAHIGLDPPDPPRPKVELHINETRSSIEKRALLGGVDHHPRRQ